MKRTLSLLAILFPVALLPLGATTIYFVGASGPPVGSFYVAPYMIQVDGGLAIPSVCDDTTHEIQTGDYWPATATVLSNGDSGLLFAGVTDSTNKYKAAAILWTWIQNSTVPAATGNYAIWNLFTNYDMSAAPGAPAAQTAALASVDRYSYSGITVYTPVEHPLGKYQELITGSASAVPEPSTLAISGLALIAVCKFGRRRKS